MACVNQHNQYQAEGITVTSEVTHEVSQQIYSQ